MLQKNWDDGLSYCYTVSLAHYIINLIQKAFDPKNNPFLVTSTIQNNEPTHFFQSCFSAQLLDVLEESSEVLSKYNMTATSMAVSFPITHMLS